jgi:membrane-associated protein
MDLLTTSAVVAFVVLAALVALDAVLPVVPAEAAVISAGVLASADRVHVALVAVASVAGAVIGDQLAYVIGRRFTVLPLDRLLPRARVRRAFVRALSGLMRHSVGTLVVARFVPFGRTASAATAGYLRFPRGRFLLGTALGGAAWTAYCLALAYVGGRLVEGPVVQRVLAAVVFGVAIGFCLDGVRRVVEIRRRITGIENWEHAAPSRAAHREPTA